MNAVQKTYMLAKAHHMALKEEMDDKEAAWIQNKRLQNPDGTTPKHLWCWETDECTWNKVCEELDDYMTPINQEINEAARLLHQAEEKLIDFGLEKLPQKEKEILNRNRNHWKYREQMIDLAYRLDE